MYRIYNNLGEYCICVRQLYVKDNRINESYSIWKKESTLATLLTVLAQ